MTESVSKRRPLSEAPNGDGGGGLPHHHHHHSFVQELAKPTACQGREIKAGQHVKRKNEGGAMESNGRGEVAGRKVALGGEARPAGRGGKRAAVLKGGCRGQEEAAILQVVCGRWVRTGLASDLPATRRRGLID